MSPHVNVGEAESGSFETEETKVCSCGEGKGVEWVKKKVDHVALGQWTRRNEERRRSSVVEKSASHKRATI
jgi:hypothetical protein